MKKVFYALIIVVLAGTKVDAADCSAPAAPSVDWQRCYHDSKNLSKVDLSGVRLQETSFQRSLLDGAVLKAADGFRARFISASLRGGGAGWRCVYGRGFHQSHCRRGIIP